jgi:protein-tyrosine phosphatase
MIDLHTHLLPDWDDGAKTWDDLAKMIEIAQKDGIRKIGLAPHLYRLNKYDSDIPLLKLKMAQFKLKTAGGPVQFYEGTEVFIHHEIIPSLRDHGLTVNGSSYFFIEFPSEYVLPGVKDLFFNIRLAGFIPIISHPERNAGFQDRPELLSDLIKMDCLAQVTAKSLTGSFGSLVKKTAEMFVAANLVHLIASDAHDPVRRPPVLSKAVEEARKIVGDKKAMAMVTSIPQAILDNQPIGDWGEPVLPAKAKQWKIKLPSFLRKKV